MTQKTQYIRELTPGTMVNDLFILSSANMGQSRNGPYWNVSFKDCTGTVNGKIWSPKSNEYPSLEAGTIARVHAVVESYRDSLQLKVEHLEFILDNNGINLADFLPASKIPPEDMLEALEDMITETMAHKPWKKLCRKVLRNETVRERLLTAPGAKTVHHAYVGGLLEHTLSVAKTCMSICNNYPELDRQTLLAGAIFHDLGKAWELSGGLANDYTDEGRLLGHIQIGQEKLQPFLAKAKDLDPGLKLHLNHLITSHHGEHEFGSPVRPKTPEAFVLHHADNLDAKMNMIEAAYEDMDQTGATWSPFLRFMDRNIFRPTPTPDATRKNRNKTENQCLLPLKA
ncbi:3'-5' exoribonuclease YhaM family protein [Pseudodesulfovibrio senegalensis]|nr:HD domain-containing protein [Pseudodesulfovibrio senegalensis]